MYFLNFAKMGFGIKIFMKPHHSNTIKIMIRLAVDSASKNIGRNGLKFGNHWSGGQNTKVRG